MDATKEPEIFEQLRKVSYFKMFDKDEKIIDSIAGMCKQRSFSAGATIIKEGDHGDELFIVLKGEIEIQKKTLQNEPYTVTSLNANIGGISVGELAMIDNDMRSATVVAKTDCRCLVINRDDFLSFGDRYPEIGLKITRAIASQLSSKLRKANEDVIILFSALVEEIATVE